MNEVISFAVTKLNNGDFYQFIENSVNIVQTEPLAAGIIAKLAAERPILLDSFKKETLTEDTKQIVLLDERRDRAFTKLRWIVTGYTFDDENVGFSAAANKLMTFIDQHGGGQLIRFNYNKETASISSLVLDVRNHASDELALLQLAPTLDYLETNNNKFKEFYATRNDAAAELTDVPPFYKLRKEATANYKRMTNDLESLQRFVPPADSQKITEVITRLNVEIDKFKLLVPKTPPPTPPTP